MTIFLLLIGILQTPADKNPLVAWAQVGCIFGWAVVQPYFMNPCHLGLKGRTGFIWFGTSILTLIWAIFRLPETIDRTYEELDILFERKVPLTKFASYKLDINDEMKC